MKTELKSVEFYNADFHLWNQQMGKVNQREKKKKKTSIWNGIFWLIESESRRFYQSDEPGPVSSVQELSLMNQLVREKLT